MQNSFLIVLLSIWRLDFCMWRCSGIIARGKFSKRAELSGVFSQFSHWRGRIFHWRNSPSRICRRRGSHRAFSMGGTVNWGEEISMTIFLRKEDFWHDLKKIRNYTKWKISLFSDESMQRRISQVELSTRSALGGIFSENGIVSKQGDFVREEIFVEVLLEEG